MSVYTYIICMYTHTHMYTHTQTHTHTNTQTHARTLDCDCVFAGCNSCVYHTCVPEHYVCMTLWCVDATM